MLARGQERVGPAAVGLLIPRNPFIFPEPVCPRRLGISYPGVPLAPAAKAPPPLCGCGLLLASKVGSFLASAEDRAPDIQEQVLFLPLIKGLNERNLRPITSRIDWDEQRRMFQKITSRLNRTEDPAG